MHTYTTRLFDPNLSGYIESEHTTALAPEELARAISAELPTITGRWTSPRHSNLLAGAEGDVLLDAPEVEIYAMPAHEIDECDPCPDYVVTPERLLQSLTKE